MKSSKTIIRAGGISARALALAGSAVAVLGATSAAAQDAAADASANETIVVTGSRIVQPNLKSTSPIAVTSAEEINETGFTRLEDVLVQLPQIEASQNAFISNGATGTATLDLRGLGSVRTLVLVNGRRLQPGSTNSVAADINQIPAALVQRVDVLTGGASSVYGADAVAGVVNFIMDDKFEGFQLDVGQSYYMHNNGDTFVTDRAKARGFAVPTDTTFDGRQVNIDMTIGGKFAEGRGHAVAYATYRKIDPILQGARDHSACALNAAGTACGGSFTTPVANFDLYPRIGGETDFSYNAFLTPSANGTLVDASDNIYNFAPVNYFQRPDERYSLGAFVNYEVSPAFKPYAEVMFMSNRSVAQIAESGTFYVDQYDFSCATGNPAITAAQLAQLCNPATYTNGAGASPASVDGFSAYIGKRNSEGGGRQNIIQHDSFRFVGGARGEISSNWSYDAYIQYGQSSLSDSYLNDFLLTKVEDAIYAGTYKVWQQGAVTPEFAQTLSATATRTGVTKEFLASAYVTGNLGFGIANDPVSTVFGAEYRNNIYRTVSDQLYEEGLLAGQGGPTPSISGKFDVVELFTEANVPLLQDLSFARDLRAELGYRFSQYSVAGGGSFDTHTFKAQLNWEVNDFLRLRGGFNRAVRAPNAPELFTPVSLGLWSGTDPCAGSAPVFTAAQCANTGVSAAQYGNISANAAAQYNAQYAGNLNLRPEKADSYTAGFVVTPARNISFAVDYYRIKMSDVIGIYPPEQLLRDCALTGDQALCSRIVRNAAGNLWQGQQGYVISPNVNLAGRDFQGLDVAATSRFNVGNGSITVGLTGSYVLKKQFQDAPTTTPYDCKGTFSAVCFVSPRWRHTLRVSYKAPEVFTVTGKWRFMSEVQGPAANGKSSIPAYSWFDLSVAADVTDNLSLSLAANNIFDRNPPLVGSAYSSNGNTFAGFYDTLGRYVSINASLRF
ncbi:MAG: TonB-dependent receptor domain-containing protein [Novosphingobium sp.]